MVKEIRVHLLPPTPEMLRGRVAVLIDVLRATTVMVQALDSGAKWIIPCLEIEEARDKADCLKVNVLLSGEREGLPIPRFDLGNSPDDFDSATVKDRGLIMTTTNGTKALLAAYEAEHVFVAAFVNALAVVERLSGEDHAEIVCAGTDGLVSWEDTLLAGWITVSLRRRWQAQDEIRVNDAALLAQSAAQSCGLLPSSGSDTTTSDKHELIMALVAALKTGRGGQRLRDIGLEADIEAAARWNRFSIVPEWEPTAGQIRLP